MGKNCPYASEARRWVCSVVPCKDPAEKGKRELPRGLLLVSTATAVARSMISRGWRLPRSASSRKFRWNRQAVRWTEVCCGLRHTRWWNFGVSRISQRVFSLADWFETALFLLWTRFALHRKRDDEYDDLMHVPRYMYSTSSNIGLCNRYRTILGSLVVWSSVTTVNWRGCSLSLINAVSDYSLVFEGARRFHIRFWNRPRNRWTFPNSILIHQKLSSSPNNS